MSAESKPKDENRPDDGKQTLSIDIDSGLDAKTNPHRHEEPSESTSCWTWISVFAAVIVLFLVVAIGGVCRSQPVDSLSWPYVAMVAVFLSAIVALCWIGCRHSVRMEKMSSEERKQKVDVRRFLFEKSVELAQALSKGGGESSKKVHSVSILLHRPCDGGNNKPDGTDNGRGCAPTPPSTPPSPPQTGGSPAATEGSDESGSTCDDSGAPLATQYEPKPVPPDGSAEVSIKIGFTNATTNGSQPGATQKLQLGMTMQSDDLWATKNDDTPSLYRKWQNDSKTATCDCSQTTAQTVTSAGRHNDQ